MNERVVTDKHFVAPLTDEEYLELRVQAARANLKIKDWVGRAIREKLERSIADGNDSRR